VLYLALVVLCWAPAPVEHVATFILLTVFLPQFLVAYKLGGFSADIGSMPVIIQYTLISYILAFPFSLGYAFCTRWIARRIRRWRHHHDESHASI
jgi:hypothetical protein